MTYTHAVCYDLTYVDGILAGLTIRDYYNLYRNHDDARREFETLADIAAADQLVKAAVTRNRYRVSKVEMRTLRPAPRNSTTIALYAGDTATGEGEPLWRGALGDFITANGFDKTEVLRLRMDLRVFGRHVIGGGAAAKSTIFAAD